MYGSGGGGGSTIEGISSYRVSLLLGRRCASQRTLRYADISTFKLYHGGL